MGGSSKQESKSGYQFGTFKGVYTPSVLTILGVVMYLRFGWVLGNVGLFKTLLIVTMSTSITMITGLSLSALATNMKIGGGGAYYIISRSLGVEAGAAVGLPLFLAQALSISFYISGFSEAFVDVFPAFTPLQVGVVTLLLLAALATLSADLALKTQFIVMAVIVTSLISFFAGGSYHGELPDPASLPPAESFWKVFAVFFPAVTGIEAGIAMSGDLKDPAKSLPRGTIGAVLTGYIIYIIIPIYLSVIFHDSSVLRDEHMSLVMRGVARWGIWIVLGVWAASLSSAMGSLLGAPRTLQALARDRVVFRFLGRGYGKGDNPRVATLIAFSIGLSGVLMGNLNVIAPVLSMFFLTSYGVLNISAGLEELMSPPAWRPKFRIPWQLSFAGSFGCSAVMFMINAGATFVAGAIVFSVYFLMEKRSLKAWWGDMRSGILMLIARNSIYALARRPPDEHSWKPNLLVMAGAPQSRWYLVELASAIAGDKSFMTVATVLPPDTEPDRIGTLSRTVSDYLEKHDVPAIVKIYSAGSALEGACDLARAYGYGPLVPNTVLVGLSENADNFLQFSKLVVQVRSHRQNLVIVRDAEESSDTFTQHEKIFVWWYGAMQNLGFMLALVHLLQRSPIWKDVEITIKSIAKDEDEQRQTKTRIDEFVAQARLKAGVEVYRQSSSGAFADIKRYSEGADLIMMGVRAPEKDETAEEYSRYYGASVGRLQGLPPTALVMASESIDFFGIFQQEK